MARRPAVEIRKDARVPDKPKRAARRTTANPETLAELGLDRLIALVLTETGRNPAFKKLVTAAVAGLQGPEAVAALIDRRLTALERARGYIDWQKRRAFAADLDATVSTIVTELASHDPHAALDRLVRFLAGAAGVLERVDDSSGRIHGLYERASDASAEIARRLPEPDAAALAVRLVPHLGADAFGLFEDLLRRLIDTLSESALPALDTALIQATPPAQRPGGKAAMNGIDAAWETTHARTRLLRLRQAIADRVGDIDGFIRLEEDQAGERPDRNAIGERLLAAGRAQEALDWVRRAQPRGPAVVTRLELLGGHFDPSAADRDRVALEIRILEALRQTEEAQRLRWRLFEERLDREMLHAYIAKLPDFEDEEALERAFDHAERHPDPYRALHFFTHWPAPGRAARLVEARADVWDGNRYEVLVPAAESLGQSEPRAASRLYRLLIDDILANGRSAAYAHGARHLASLDALAERIGAGGLDPEPEAYRHELRRAHGRKAAFWAQVNP